MPDTAVEAARPKYVHFGRGVYQVFRRAGSCVPIGTVHRVTDGVPRYWYAYDARFVGTARTRQAAGRLLLRRRRRPAAPKE